MAALLLSISPAANAATGECGDDVQVPCPAVTIVDSSLLDQLRAENAALKATNQYLADDNDTIHLTNEVLQQENTKFERDYDKFFMQARTGMAATHILIVLLGIVLSLYFANFLQLRSMKHPKPLRLK